MRLANALCRFVELVGRSVPPPVARIEAAYCNATGLVRPLLEPEEVVRTDFAAERRGSELFAVVPVASVPVRAIRPLGGTVDDDEWPWCVVERDRVAAWPRVIPHHVPAMQAPDQMVVRQGFRS
jgi:hypothetical protein